MQIKLFYRVILTDENGKIVKRSPWKKSRSFLIAFLKNINAFMGGTITVAGPTVTTKDVDGVNQTISVGTTAAYYYLRCKALDDNDTYGFVVGTGTTPPTNSDYALAAKIAHGVGVGQLDYGSHSTTEAAIVDSNVDFIMSRSFYNGSGASITVNEIGIISYTYDKYYLIVRDVVTAIAVGNTQTLTVQYTFRTTV